MDAKASGVKTAFLFIYFLKGGKYSVEFRCPYWSAQTKIEMLQRWIVVHSALYYVHDKPIVSDSMYDNNCRQLIQFKSKYPKSYKRARYTYAMKNFDGNTGYGIYEKLNKDDKYFVDLDIAMLTTNKLVKKER